MRGSAQSPTRHQLAGKASWHALLRLDEMAPDARHQVIPQLIVPELLHLPGGGVQYRTLDIDREAAMAHEWRPNQAPYP